jgi:hypothetical protein
MNTRWFALVVCSFAATSCGSAGSSVAPPADGGASAGTAQVPPITSGADIESWLAMGFYKSWHCEAASSPGSGLSPHGAHRICSNDVLSSFSGSGEYPVGAANVKELFDAVGGHLVGHAIELHAAAGTNGNDWFWYEKLDGSAPVADATGVSLCVGCHAAAGSDAMHPGHDFVYSQVR